MAIKVPVDLDTSKFDSAVKDMEDKAKSAGKNVKQGLEEGAEGLDNFKEAAGGAGSSAGKLAGLLGSVSPAAGETAHSVNDLADAIEIASIIMEAMKTKGLSAMIASLGPLGLALGVATLAFSAYQSEAEDSKKATEDAKAAAEHAQTAYENLSTALFKATIKQKELRGEITASQAAAAIAGQDLAKQFLPPITEAATKLAAMQAESEKLTKKLGSGGLGTASLQHKIDDLNASIEVQKQTVADLSKQYVDLYDTTTDNITVEGNLKTTKDELTKSSKDHTEALKKEAEALKANADLLTGVDTLLKGWSAGMGLVGSDATLAAQEVDNAVADINSSLGGMSAAAVDAMLGIDDAAKKTASSGLGKIKDALKDAISGLQGGLEGIIGLVGGPVAGAIAGLILNLSGTISGLVDEIKGLPKLLKSIPKLALKLVTGILDVLPSLLKAIPKLIDGLVDAVPKIAVALVVGIINAIPALIQTLVKLLVTYLAAQSGYLATQIVIALIKGLVDAFKSFWDKFSSGELVDGLKQAALEAVVLFFVKLRAGVEDAIDTFKSFFTIDFWKSVWQGLKDVLKELLTLGGAKTKTFGDSPGMQRAGPNGDTIRTSPGDYYVAGRNPAELLGAALDGLGGSGYNQLQPAYAPTVNLAWQHRAFDGFFARHASLNGRTSELFKTVRRKDARGL